MRYERSYDDVVKLQGDFQDTETQDPAHHEEFAQHVQSATALRLMGPSLFPERLVHDGMRQCVVNMQTIIGCIKKRV